MKSSLILFSLIILSRFVSGQASHCQFDTDHRVHAGAPSYTAFRKALEQKWKEPDFSTRSVVWMPVVIHVVARDPVQPVSIAQAQQQIDVLNADFAGMGGNADRLPDAFQVLLTDVMIRFCLATIDPEGQPTTGITFTSTDIQDIALETGEGGRKSIHWDQLGGKTGWDPTRYINIWVGEYGSVLGSANFPGMANYPEEIGVVIDPKYFGAIGDAASSGNYDRGHTLTHEMGHYFGLKHIWGDGLEYICEDSDDIDDTPNASGPYYDCPAGSQQSCGTDNMYQNFMDFTDDRCLALFTPGQSMVMRAVRELYYPDVLVTAPCADASASFEAWTESLVWAFDAPGRAYVIYGRETWFMGSRVDVYAMDGKLVQTGRWDDELSYLIDLENMAAGMYVVRIQSGSKSFVRKLVVY